MKVHAIYETLNQDSIGPIGATIENLHFYLELAIRE